uniref:Uncharacterized protein n=1 Tax=Human herpesvirus 1 TaxID=10298 RepID=A0A2Z4H178_HHV1|nr:hypothetical protein [Human alphaherpesvirus 1]
MPSDGHARAYTYPRGPGGTLMVVAVLGFVSMSSCQSVHERR